MPNAAASDWEREYYGANRERLRQVKANYDPENVFSFEQSIPSASRQYPARSLSDRTDQ